MSQSQVPPEAIKTLQNFLDASLRKDKPAMEALLTKQSLASGTFNGQGPEGLRLVMGEAKMEGDKALINVKGFPLEAPEAGEPAMTMPCLLVQEDGHWKFDLMATMERMLGGSLETVMTQLAEGMGQAMEGIGQALSEAMGGPAKEKEEKDEKPPKRFENLN
jgi:hypothetical protein